MIRALVTATGEVFASILMWVGLFAIAAAIYGIGHLLMLLGPWAVAAGAVIGLIVFSAIGSWFEGVR